MPALLAVPAQTIQAALGPHALHDEAGGVLEAARVMRRVGREQEHFAFLDVDVLEELVAVRVLLDHLEAHGALELVEPLLGLVDVVVVACVGPAHHHEHKVGPAQEAVVVHGRLEERFILREPGGEA